MRPRVATAWLGGCSGCHMSLLDLDERLLELAPRLTLVASPLCDAKGFPEDVAVALVEGAVCTDEQAALARRLRSRSRVLVALGDCAVDGNVTALRNPLGGARAVLDRAYLDLADLRPGVPPRVPEAPGLLPVLLDRVRPLHEVVEVDLFLPGCPPAPALLHAALVALLDGRRPDLSGILHRG